MDQTEREALVNVLDWVWHELDKKTEYYDVWEEAMYDNLRDDYARLILSEEYKQGEQEAES